MDLKKTIGRIGKDALLKQATSKILPMEGAEPKNGKKAKVVAGLSLIAVIATAAAQFLGG